MNSVEDIYIKMISEVITEYMIYSLLNAFAKFCNSFQF